MGRPRDLPQPVRNHPAHRGPTPVGCSPGPAYEGYGVTQFDKDHRLGIITGSRDARSSPRGGGQQQQQQRPLSETTPGPIYNNHNYNSSKTRLAASIPRAKRFDDTNRSTISSNPGPGAYDNSDGDVSRRQQQKVSSTMGTMARSRRQPLSNGNNFPAGADYTPNVAPTKNYHGSSSFPHASVKQRNARTVAKCETSDAGIAGHDEFHIAEKWTRPSSVSTSIGRGPRFAREIRQGSGEVGPGQYDSSGFSRFAGRSAPSVGFAMGTRKYKNYMTFQEMDKDVAATGGGTAHQILPSTLSTRGVKISPNTNNNINTNNNNSMMMSNQSASSATSLYHPDISQTRPSSKSVSFGRASRFTRDARPASAAAADPNIPSTLDVSHGAKIGTSKRFTMTEQQRECFQHPSPAEYTPTLPKRPESAARSILNRNEKIGQLLRESQITPGPKYESIDMNLTRESLSKQSSFPRSDRGLSGKIEKDFNSPGVGAYDTSVDPRSKRGPSAILYLGA